MAAMSDLSKRVRVRLREEMARRNVSQPDVAAWLDWSQSRVAQKLTGRTPITLDELELLTRVIGLGLVEAVRDPGLEFCADMTPSEVRLLETLRRQPPAVRDAVLTLVNGHTIEPERFAKAPKPKTLKRRAG